MGCNFWTLPLCSASTLPSLVSSKTHFTLAVSSFAQTRTPFCVFFLGPCVYQRTQRDKRATERGVTQQWCRVDNQLQWKIPCMVVTFSSNPSPACLMWRGDTLSLGSVASFLDLIQPGERELQTLPCLRRHLN